MCCVCIVLCGLNLRHIFEKMRMCWPMLKLLNFLASCLFPYVFLILSVRGCQINKDIFGILYCVLSISVCFLKLQYIDLSGPLYLSNLPCKLANKHKTSNKAKESGPCVIQQHTDQIDTSQRIVASSTGRMRQEPRFSSRLQFRTSNAARQ